MHVFSRFKSRVHLYAISSHRWTTITYHLHITADREFKELSVDLEWILYSKELKDDLLLINTASKKKTKYRISVQKSTFFFTKLPQ